MSFRLALPTPSEIDIQLLDAVSNGNALIVENILLNSANLGVNINVRDSEGNTALMIAARVDHLDIVETLLNHGADINMQNKLGNSALTLAASKNQYDMVHFLLLNNADPNIVNKEGWSALMLAIKTKDTSTVEVLLINSSTNIEIQNNRGNTALILAAAQDDIEMVQMLLDYIPINLEAKNKKGNTALMVAAFYNRLDIVMLLIRKEANIDAENNNGDTALILACKKSHVKVVKYLLNNNVNTKIRNNNNDNAFSSAASQNNLEILTTLFTCETVDTRLLIKNAQNNNGDTPLILATRTDHFKIVNYLLSQNVNIGINNFSGETAQTIALKNDFKNIQGLFLQHIRLKEANNIALLEISKLGHLDSAIELLYKRIYDINTTNEQYETPLILAAANNHYNLVQNLLKFGANKDAQRKSGDSALMLAAHNGHDLIVSLLLDKGADVNIVNEDGFTALMCAINQKQIIVVKTLLRSGRITDDRPNKNGDTLLPLAAKVGHAEIMRTLLAYRSQSINSESVLRLNIETKAGHGFTALMFAANYNHPEIVTALLENGAKPNAQNNNGDTPLILAASRGYIKVVKLLILNNVDITITNNDGETAETIAIKNNHSPVRTTLEKYRLFLNNPNAQLLVYARQGRTDLVSKVLQKSGIDVNTRSDGKTTPLIIAAYNGHLDVVKTLLTHDADPDAQNNINYTALIAAASRGKIDVVNFLLTQKVDKEHQDTSGNTALIAAASKGYADVVHVLLEHGVNINHKNKYNDTALISASNNGHSHIVHTLLENDVNLEIKNYVGQNALIVASGAKKGAITRLLLAKGANKDACDNNGYTALRIAAICNNIEAVRVLLEYSANTELFDDTSRDTPLIIAAFKGHLEIVQLLLAHGVNTEAKNNNGKTALILAKEKNHETIVNLLSNKQVHNIYGKTFMMRLCSQGNEETVNSLLVSGYDQINAQNYNGETVLMHSVTSGHLGIVKLLLNYGADLAISNANHDTAMTLAEKNNQKDILLLLQQTKPSFSCRLTNFHGEIPDISRCPIFATMINDPITVASGITYDREFLRQYFKSKDFRSKIDGHIEECQFILCPITKLKISRRELDNGTDVTIRSLNERFVIQYEMEHKQKHEVKKESIEELRTKRLLHLSKLFSSSSSTASVTQVNVTTSSVEEIPTHVKCPISLCLIKDPVTLANGYTYDREFILAKFDQEKSNVITCPQSGYSIYKAEVTDRRTNVKIKNMIAEWVKEKDNTADAKSKERPQLDMCQY